MEPAWNPSSMLNSRARGRPVRSGQKYCQMRTLSSWGKRRNGNDAVPTSPLSRGALAPKLPARLTTLISLLLERCYGAGGWKDTARIKPSSWTSDGHGHMEHQKRGNCGWVWPGSVAVTRSMWSLPLNSLSSNLDTMKTNRLVHFRLRYSHISAVGQTTTSPDIQISFAYRYSVPHQVCSGGLIRYLRRCVCLHLVAYAMLATRVDARSPSISTHHHHNAV